MKSIMFIAPPAAGKGTQAEIIANKYNIPHISTGNILREIAKENTEIGNYIYETMSNGDLVKDEITYKLIENRLSLKDCKNGYIIDGFPRNLEQAIKYDEILKKVDLELGYVFALNIDKKELEKRVIGRRIFENSNTTYNINEEHEMPRIESICDICGGNLYQRKDDNLDAFEARYKNYLEQTTDIIKYYEEKNILYHINGNASVEKIAQEIDSIISKEGKKNDND